MADRQGVLRETIQKLLSLGLTDEEIIQNLMESGVSERESKSVLKSIKGSAPKVEEAVEEDAEEDEEEPDADSSGQEDEPKEVEVEEPPKPERRSAFFEQTQRAIQSAPDNSVDVWGKGILATIDSKVAQMEKIREETDKNIEKKITVSFEREMKKFTAVFEGQRTLIVEKTNKSLDSKKKEFEELVNMKISELRQMNSLGEEYFKKLESSKKFNENLLATMEAKVNELSKAKNALVSDMTFQVAGLKKEFQSFLDESEKKRDELNERINKSLHLETQIVEGLLNDAQNKIDRLAIDKAAELEKMVDSKFEAKSQAIQKIFSEKERKIDSSFGELKSSLQNEVVGLEALKKNIDAEKVKSTLEELTVYRKQFVSMIEKSISSFETAKADLQSLIERREALIDQKLAVLDQKVKEIDFLEQKLMEKIAIGLDAPKPVEAKKRGLF